VAATDRLTVTVDAAALIAAIDRLPAAILARLRDEAAVTAHRIATEARARVARRTGETAGGILVQETDDGRGYRVTSTHERMPNLPQRLEFGTASMRARPYLFVSADLHAADHHRRIVAATQDAIDASGIGA
jgi:hypothetical protein